MVANRGPATSAVTIVLTVLATVFVAARFFTRIYLVRSVKRDDWWILAAWVVAVGFSASICVAVKYGLGKHKADIPEGSFAALQQAEYAFAILYNPSLMLTKTSIIVFYLSVMSKDVDPVFKWCNWLTLAVVNICGLALTFFNIFQCRPVAAGYQYPQPAHAKCTDIVTLYLSSAPVNIITDLALLFLPMPILTGMRLPRKQKIILIATFGIGAFVAVVDVVRIAYLQEAALNRLKLVKAAEGSPGRIEEDNDFSWYASLSFMWSAVEVCIGIICACVPSLKPLFLRFLPSFVKDTGDSLNSSDTGDPGQLAPTDGSSDSRRANVSALTHPAAFRKSVVKEYSGDDAGDGMGFLNMLAGPPLEGEGPPMARSMTSLSQRSTTRSAASDFGFVKMSAKRNMLKLSNRQSAWPIAVVTVIFFLWGFAYGLLDALNARFQTVVGLSTGKTLGLHAAYYGGYFAGPLTLGRFILKRYGFKAVMMAGLAVYGCGTLVFWPSAVLTSYAAFIFSNIIVGFGLSCLEVAANPYIALCGPLEYAEVRLNLSQAFQAVGTVCSPLLATKVLFKNVLDAPSLVDVQWTYLGIAIFVFGLAIVFYYVPLPEASDEQLAEMADRRSAAYAAQVGPWKVVYVTLALGIFSQWCYVGLQECVSNNLQPLILSVRPNSNLQPFDFQTLAHTVFATGRFISALLNYLFKPRWILLALYIGLIVCLALNMNLEGDAGAAVGLLTFLFESGIFAITFAISMRGLGSHTKTGAALMTAAISGGAVFPPIQWGVANSHGLRYSYCVPLAVAVFGMMFAVYLNLVPAARVQVDPIHERRINRRERRTMREESASAMQDEKTQQFGLAGILARRRIGKREEKVTVEHVERPTDGDGSNSKWAPMSPILTMDFADEKNEAQRPVSAPVEPFQGLVADLARWPDEESSEASGGGSSDGGDRSQGGKKADPKGKGNDDHNDDDMVISRQRPRWEEHNLDEDTDDYHTVLRQF